MYLRLCPCSTRTTAFQRPPCLSPSFPRMPLAASSPRNRWDIYEHRKRSNNPPSAQPRASLLTHQPGSPGLCSVVALPFPTPHCAQGSSSPWALRLPRSCLGGGPSHPPAHTLPTPLGLEITAQFKVSSDDISPGPPGAPQIPPVYERHRVLASSAGPENIHQSPQTYGHHLAITSFL